METEDGRGCHLTSKGSTPARRSGRRPAGVAGVFVPKSEESRVCINAFPPGGSRSHGLQAVGPEGNSRAHSHARKTGRLFQKKKKKRLLTTDKTFRPRFRPAPIKVMASLRIPAFPFVRDSIAPINTMRTFRRSQAHFLPRFSFKAVPLAVPEGETTGYVEHPSISLASLCALFRPSSSSLCQNFGD